VLCKIRASPVHWPSFTQQRLPQPLLMSRYLLEVKHNFRSVPCRLVPSATEFATGRSLAAAGGRKGEKTARMAIADLLRVLKAG
jgi:hypothetical protein